MQFVQRLEQEVQRLQGVKKEQEDRYELDSANKSAFERARLALGYGLIETALKAAQEHLQQMNDGSVEGAAAAPGLEIALKLMIATGQIDEARLLVQAEVSQGDAQRRPDRARPGAARAAAEDRRLVSGPDRRRVRRLRRRRRNAHGSSVKITNQVRFGPDGKPQNAGVPVAVALGDQLLLQSAEVGRVAGIGFPSHAGAVPENASTTIQCCPCRRRLQYALEAENRDAPICPNHSRLAGGWNPGTLRRRGAS